MLHASDIRKASSSHACPLARLARPSRRRSCCCSRSARVPPRRGSISPWNACNQEAAGRGDLTFDCADTDQVRHALRELFQVPATIPDFFARDAVLDIEVNGAGVPPFWHFETGGCKRRR